MKRIGVITTGGDAPGMNACLRAIVRVAAGHGLEVVGIEEGYAGLIKGSAKKMDHRSVSGIINRGGTILRTERCEGIKTHKGLAKASETIRKNGLDGLVVIGGDGSLRAALELYKLSKIPIIGIPASIDNDIAGTETTIGFDTAVNTALQAIDKIRDTALSHERIFIVEVMGRERGFLALEVGLVSGAEMVLIPEMKYSLDEITSKLKEWRKKGKQSIIVVMAEGAGNPNEIADHLRKVTGYDVRVSSLGYIQRGGSPTAASIRLASLFGYLAVKSLLKTRSPKMLGVEKGKIITRPLDYPSKRKKEIDKELYKLVSILSS